MLLSRPVPSSMPDVQDGLTASSCFGTARTAYARADGPPFLQLVNHGKGSPIYPGIRPMARPPP